MAGASNVPRGTFRPAKGIGNRRPIVPRGTWIFVEERGGNPNPIDSCIELTRMKPMKIIDPLSTPSRTLVPAFSRRQALQGALALAATAALQGCGGSVSGSTTTPPPSGNPQPTPSGPITQASLTVTSTANGSIGPAFAGLSYEKSSLYEKPYLFTASNANMIGLFQRLGPSVLRVGGNSVDRNVWTPSGAGQTAGQIAP